MPVHEQDFLGALRTVAIYGPGLIGGSLGLALQKFVPGSELRLWARPHSVEKTVRAFPGATVTDDPCAAADGADVLVFCCPVEGMEPLARLVAPVVSNSAIVTDAGSVKAGVVTALESVFGSRFVGAHPMAGSEQCGVEAAEADLYEGATCILTPTALSSPEVVERTANFWKTVGCRILTMSPAMHDRLVARSSHLPHAVASALVNAVVESAPEAIDVTGSGFRDTTRVAGGPEGMWTGIFMENRMEVLGAVREMQARLAEFSGYLEAQDTLGLEKFLLRARDVRKDLE